MNEWVDVHIACPCGKSSDAYCINDKGWGTCFSCNKKFPPNDMEKETLTVPEDSTYVYYAHREISKTAFSHYEASVRVEDGEHKEVGFKYPNGAVKIRLLSDKKFFSHGPMKDAHLYGQDKFDRGGKVLTITEGEYDALAVWDLTRTPTVSVRSSSSARSDCKKEWDYINSFDKIIIAFDNDEPGDKASREVAALFDFNKVHKVVMSLSDPNEYLLQNKGVEFVELWKNCKKYTPDNIISEFSEIQGSLSERKATRLSTYPIKGLQDALYGLYTGEVIVFKGDEGIGKTEIFRALEYHILSSNPDSRMGIIHLEESQGDTIRALATYSDKHPYVHLEDNSSEEQIMEAYKKAVNNDPNRVYIYTSFDIEDEQGLLDNMRFLVTACGCQFIFLDHITWLATGGEGDDERRKLDRLSQKMKLLAKELDFCLIMISHTNDDGKTRGSRNISKVGNTVIHMSRDKEALSDMERRKTYFTVEKGRGGGTTTGEAGYALFDPETLTLQSPPTATTDLP